MAPRMARLLDTLFPRRTARRRTGVRADWPGLDVPLHTDWAWRPAPWTTLADPAEVAHAASGAALGPDMKVFHDAGEGAVTLRQVSGRTAAFAVHVQTREFDGSFLSLVVDLPEAALRDIERRHVFRAAALLERDEGTELFARLNVRNGPNIEQIVREVAVPDAGPFAVEFDLAYTKMNARRVDAVWLDLIFEGCGNDTILMRDLVLSRRPRLDL